jgi:glycosyltransferase involved in cell wall biosynthesis
VSRISIAYQAPAWPASMSSNGISKYVERVLPALMSMGVEPLVFAFDHGGALPGGVPSFPVEYRPQSLLEKVYRKLSPAGFDRFRFRRSFLPVLKAHGVDILEMEEARGDSLYLGDDPGVKVVLRLHGPWFLNGAALGLREDAVFAQRVERERQAILAAKHITAPSQDVIDRTAAYYRIDLSRAVCIPNPIEIPPETDCWQASLADPHLLLFVGRFDRHKGADILLQAFAKLKARHPLLRLAFVGPDRGLVGANGEVVGLKAYLASELPPAVVDAIDCLGELGQADIGQLRRKALLTVAPSRYDNFPYTVLESLSLGCPTIASDAGGASEMITSGVNGWLFESGSVDSLADVISKALSQGRGLGEMAHAGRVSVIERYSPEVVARRLYEHYRSML